MGEKSSKGGKGRQRRSVAFIGDAVMGCSGGPFGGRHMAERSGGGPRLDRQATGGRQRLGHGACVCGARTGEDGALMHGPATVPSFKITKPVK
jgi:hypothetical protein